MLRHGNYVLQEHQIHTSVPLDEVVGITPLDEGEGINREGWVLTYE